MTHCNFIKERSGGFTRLVFVRNYDLPMNQVMQHIGIAAVPDALREVSSSIAAECIASLLWKDMAYGHEFMSLEKARDYANSYIGQFDFEQVRFYTNGSWHEYHVKSGCAYTPLTEATFSAVILAVHPQFAAGLIIEDED